jgi:hypothetical protein
MRVRGCLKPGSRKRDERSAQVKAKACACSRAEVGTLRVELPPEGRTIDRSLATLLCVEI